MDAGNHGPSPADPVDDIVVTAGEGSIVCAEVGVWPSAAASARRTRPRSAILGCFGARESPRVDTGRQVASKALGLRTGVAVMRDHRRISLVERHLAEASRDDRPEP